MTLTQRLGEYVRACFTGLWIRSHEHQDAIVGMAQLCQDEDWQLATWDLESGLQSPSCENNVAVGDPLGAVRTVSSLANPDGTVIVVLQNFHRFLQSAEIVQALIKQVIAGKQNRCFVAILSPTVSLTIELEKLFIVLEHDLPDRDQLCEIAEGIATEEGEFPTGTDREILLDSAVGQGLRIQD